MKSAGEMRAQAERFFNTTAYTDLQKRWDTDFDLYTLKPYDAGEKYYSFTSNRPRLVVNKAISMISDAKLQIRCPDEVFMPSDTREISNNIERLAYGVLTLQDDRYACLPDYPTLRGQMAWFACMRGMIILRVYVYKDKKGNTRADIALWDAYNTAYWQNEEGIYQGIYRRKATKEEIKSLYDVDIEKDSDIIYDCWDETNNGVFCGDRWLKEPTPHGLDYCPVYVIRAGMMPIAQRTGQLDPGRYMGEGILAENRLIYPMLNKTMSDALTIVRRGVMVPLGIWSSGGQRTLDNDLWQVEDGSLVPMDSDRNESIKPLIEPSMPTDTLPLVNWLQQEEESGGFSPLALGMIDTNSRMSGYAINMIQSSTSTKIIPFLSTLERAYKLILRSILQQYKAKSWKPLEVWGRTSKNQPFGMPAPVKIAPADIEADWNLEVQLLPIFPKDDSQRYELARLATQGDRPLLSVKSAQEELLNLDDADLETEWIDAEWANTLPLLRLLKAYKAAKTDKDEIKAQTILSQVRQLTAQMAPQAQPQTQPGQMGANMQPNQPNQMSMATPGAGVPSGATGLSPQVMPPEMMGGMPAGAGNAKGA